MREASKRYASQDVTLLVKQTYLQRKDCGQLSEGETSVVTSRRHGNTKLNLQSRFTTPTWGGCVCPLLFSYHLKVVFKNDLLLIVSAAFTEVEIIFLVALVCLSVCLSATYLKKLWMNFD